MAASFYPLKLNKSDVNNGQMFAKGDGFSAVDLNAITNGILYLNENMGSGVGNFSPSDYGKFVTIGENGELVATNITVGGSY